MILPLAGVALLQLNDGISWRSRHRLIGDHRRLILSSITARASSAFSLMHYFSGLARWHSRFRFRVLEISALLLAITLLPI